MKSADLVIVGGGMVGLALAAQLKDADCQIKIIEQSPPEALTRTGYANRVSAINPKSVAMLQAVGAFDLIPLEQRSPYQKMAIWEKDSFAELHFDCQDSQIKSLGLEQLGFILENQQIQLALWQVVEKQPNVEFIFSTPSQMGISENGVFLTLANGEMLSTKLIVGADGIHSWVRQQANLPLSWQDYGHSALVCKVKTAEAHQQTARQIFAPDSILAFLPLPDEHYCSIVWSLPPEQAEKLKNCDEVSFNKHLTTAFDGKLGLCEVQSERAIYPLTARYARNFAQARVALIGDAAHSIHPLAGLGVNLGFGDAISLAQSIKQSLEQGVDIGEYRQLRDFERARKAQAVKLLTAMAGLKTLFAGDHPLKKLARGVGLKLTDQLPLVKQLLISQAIEV